MRPGLRPLLPLALLSLAAAPGHATPATPKWQPAPAEAPAPGWELAGDEPLPAEYQPQPAVRLARELAAAPKEWVSTAIPPVIAAVGGGMRLGLGEPTYGMASARLGVPLSEQLGLSIRPGYIFGNSDSRGNSNQQGAWQIPLTLDLMPTAKASPYIGAGVATNTDSSGDTNAMISTGIDINMTRHLSLGLVLNYILQPVNDNNRRDFESQALLYLRL